MNDYWFFIHDSSDFLKKEFVEIAVSSDKLKISLLIFCFVIKN